MRPTYNLRVEALRADLEADEFDEMRLFTQWSADIYADADGSDPDDKPVASASGILVEIPYGWASQATLAFSEHSYEGSCVYDALWGEGEEIRPALLKRLRLDSEPETVFYLAWLYTSPRQRRKGLARRALYELLALALPTVVALVPDRRARSGPTRRTLSHAELCKMYRRWGFFTIGRTGVMAGNGDRVRSRVAPGAR
jgi:GNAT superfamily N-acetyltransferase